ncbi:uncharacterized protein LOC141933496 [Strix aluco]|uniref:uncharacterized protein LOC141933496 n=1 Tax=Strix aluco TaxID=111821 RepID=UPI003DA6B854
MVSPASRSPLQPHPRWRRRGPQESGGEAACGARPAGGLARSLARWPAGRAPRLLLPRRPRAAGSSGSGRRQAAEQLHQGPLQHVAYEKQEGLQLSEFACNTSVAWDIGDDEDEDFSSSSSSLQTLNSKVAKSTAAQVLENHSKLRAKPEWTQSALSDVPTNCKVIKSSSEAQLSRTADELRKCSWPGVPREVRPVTWRLLSVSTRSCDAGVWEERGKPGTCAARPSLCPVSRVISLQTWSSKS